MKKIKHAVTVVKNTGLVHWIGLYNRRWFRNFFERRRLKNRTPSIISQNCIGGVLSHDLGLRFNSPTINLFMDSKDYIAFLENLHYCMDSQISIVESDKRYPKATITLPDGLTIGMYFPHDKDEEVIKSNWEKRRKRVNWDNLFVIGTDRDGLDESILERFSRLPYKKILLSSKPYPKYDFVKYYPEYKDEKQVPDMLKIINVFGTRQYGNGWDYVKWLNE